MLWLLCVLSLPAHARIDIKLHGGAQAPLAFVLLPLDYIGVQASLSVVVEQALVQAISEAGLFHMPLGYHRHTQQRGVDFWRAQGARFVLQGLILEQRNGTIDLTIEIIDVMQPETQNSRKVGFLNRLNLRQGLYQTAKELHLAMFYQSVMPIEQMPSDAQVNLYHHNLAVHLKQRWSGFSDPEAHCDVGIEQWPGGRVGQVKWGNGCFDSETEAQRLQQWIEAIDPLPYRHFEHVFDRQLHIQLLGVKEKNAQIN